MADSRTSSGLRRLGFAVAALLGVAAFGTLGAWQWSRGAQKEAMLAWQAAALVAPPVAVDAALAQDAARRVQGRATFRSPLLMLDGQRHEGVVGVRVYGVADIAGGSPVLTELGWLPLPGDRTLPAVAPPQGEVDIAGLLIAWPGQGLRAADNPWPAALREPVLLSYLDAAEIGTAFGVGIPRRVLKLDPSLPYGWARNLELLPNTLPPERHRGYAVQWFALAATVAIVYLVLTVRAARRRKLPQ